MQVNKNQLKWMLAVSIVFVAVLVIERPTAPSGSFQVEKNSKILLDLKTALSLGTMTEKHVISEGGCMGGYLKPIPAIDLEDLSIQYDETKEAEFGSEVVFPLQ